MDGLVRGPARPTIALTDTTVTFDDPGGPGRVLSVDGSEAKELSGPERAVTTRAQWKGRYLRVLREPARGPKSTEQYRVQPVTGRLYVVVEITSPSGGEPVRFRRIYDRE